MLLAMNLQSLFPFSPLNESSPVRLDVGLKYVLGFFGNDIRLNVAVPSHDILEAGPGTEVLHNLVDDINIVGTGTTFSNSVSKHVSRSLRRSASVFWLLTQWRWDG